MLDDKIFISTEKVSEVDATVMLCWRVPYAIGWSYLSW